MKDLINAHGRIAKLNFQSMEELVFVHIILAHQLSFQMIVIEMGFNQLYKLMFQTLFYSNKTAKEIYNIDPLCFSRNTKILLAYSWNNPEL